MQRRILTINSHEAWVHQLGYLGVELDIVDGAPGRYCASWDTRVRPVPQGARLIRLADVLREQATGERPPYDCLVAHSVTDLLDLKTVEAARILVLHVTLEGRARNEGRAQVPAGYANMVRDYLRTVGGHAVAVSAFKARSWGLESDIVPFAVDLDAYPEYDGSVPAGIRISNQISSRRDYLHWPFHETAFRDIPVRIVGHNPDMPGVEPSADWSDLKSQLRQHRFFVHTASPELEDGYNMATLEAMATGLPVLGNTHPSSLIEHGQNGFCSADPHELAAHARQLLNDLELSRALGKAGRATVAARFSMNRFVDEFRQSIEKAIDKWRQHKR